MVENVLALSVFAVGLYFTVGTRFFQIRKAKLWLFGTVKDALQDKKNKKSAPDGLITQFQSLTGSLAAAIGTGNIVGVSLALITGGAGAIFWMWISAFFGMMTSCAEKILGIRYRFKDINGEYIGGAPVYMEKGLKSKIFARVYAFLCVLVSFGMGNLSQANSISAALYTSFNVPPLLTGIVTAVLVGAVIIGGIKRIASVTEKLIPFMTVIYILGGMIVILTHIENLPSSIKMIFKNAFTLKAVSGGVGGYLFKIGVNKRALVTGVSAGVFSNEAGLGSSVFMHCKADTDSPGKQGLWGIFEVFTDTLVVCSVTALSILCSGVYSPNVNADPLLLCTAAFSTVFGSFGGKFISFGIVLFAFATLVGWSYYGEASLSYLLGERAATVYKLAFAAMIVLGSAVKTTLAWDISEKLNALAAVPNLIALTALSGEVFGEIKAEYGE